jgi:hypothetical protein
MEAPTLIQGCQKWEMTPLKNSLPGRWEQGSGIFIHSRFPGDGTGLMCSLIMLQGNSHDTHTTNPEFTYHKTGNV